MKDASRPDSIQLVFHGASVLVIETLFKLGFTFIGHAIWPSFTRNLFPEESQCRQREEYFNSSEEEVERGLEQQNIPTELQPATPVEPSAVSDMLCEFAFGCVRRSLKRNQRCSETAS